MAGAAAITLAGICAYMTFSRIEKPAYVEQPIRKVETADKTAVVVKPASELSAAQLETAVLDYFAEGKHAEARKTFDALVKKSPSYTAELALKGGKKAEIVDAVYNGDLARSTKHEQKVLAVRDAWNTYDLMTSRNEISAEDAAVDKRITLYKLIEGNK